MKVLILLFLILFAYICPIKAQTTNVRWEPLLINKNKRIWYDAVSAGTVNKDILNVWILQMHHPPLEFKELDKKIYRTKTEYCINLTNEKYGIRKAEYYGSNNNLIYKFNYHLDNYPDSLKYTYPVKDNFFITLLLKKIKSKEPH